MGQISLQDQIKYHVYGLIIPISKMKLQLMNKNIDPDDHKGKVAVGGALELNALSKG